ncbi:gamma-glutamyltransferase family protein [Castellaniella sp. GW247-6E4]|uniref:gamma-glutamyltransferase family protein n=1 Tax=Castellaniella sp. GW247-6E4 TaxID=3140380 RepID=UPI0033153D4E
MPVLASNAVATSQPLAAQAGLRMLLLGGNAVDAALAAAIALTVVEPTMNGIGGDAFVLVWDQGRLHGLNASGRAPATWTPDRFAGRDAMPLIGWDTVTVPGQVAGWADLSRRFGKLPFSDLFTPAIAYAENGYYVSPVIARQWAEQVEVLGSQPGFAQAFLRDGKAPRAGEQWRFPAQARTLERIAQTMGRDFYEGELADRIAAFAQETGGALRRADLVAHVNEWVEPISVPYRDGYVVHEIPPNGQGIAALMALGMLDTLEPARGLDDAARLFHLPIEALKLAFADLYAYVGEPSAMGSMTADLLQPDYLARRARLIDPGRAGGPTPGIPRNSGTVYLTTADASGMMVSYIQSNYKGFGSGVVVPDTGIALHNRGRDFSLAAGHFNQVGPGKRPLHTIIPGFLSRRGQPVAGFGVMGGNMQAQGHVQVVQQLVDLQHNPQAALDAPRFRIQPGASITLESAVPTAVADALSALGHSVEVQPADSLDFGSGQIIQRRENGAYVAGTDPRRDGVALGY